MGQQDSSSAETARDEIGASDRFEIRECLGSGAFGTVYEAFDRERGGRVALKRLHRSDPTAIYRFKKEFRALADISHPSLVRLFDLLSDGERWFYTMELVDGVPLLEYLRGPALEPADPSGVQTKREARGVSGGIGDEPTEDFPVSGGAAPILERPDYARVRSVFRKLAEGVSALHASGKLHRDLKSQNALVTREGRVVLLDFGLIHELAQDPEEHDTADGYVVGTPLYMAPEQIAGAPLAEPADWYAVGVLLFRALTGRFPFEGRVMEISLAKQTRDPPDPADHAPDVPDDLRRLCLALLRRDPSRRATGPIVLEALGGPTAPLPAASAAIAARRRAAETHPFVGRDAELAALEEAYDETRRGRGVAVWVTGGSGMGKTALVQHFLRGLGERDPGAVILEGRCYARESLPYKALDAVIDSLSRRLANAPREETAALLPRHVAHLSRLFPVVRRVPVFDEAAREVDAPDPQERRRRGLDALRELFARLADRRPLVVFIDDLQWADVDSAAVLSRLLQPPEPPAMLLIGTWRSEEAETSPFLKALRALEGSGDITPRRIAVGALPQETAEALARTLLKESGAEAGDAARIAAEASHNPLFIDQLVDHVRRGRSELGGTLAEVIEDRIRRLPDVSRRLLEVLAVAGQPIDQRVARAAVGLESLDDAGVRELSTQRLVRTRAGEAALEVIELYHDRIRETVGARLDAAREKEHHRQLALAMEANESADAEPLAVHWRAAGDDAKARAYAVRAADAAADAFAFDRAARLYRMALDLGPPAGETHALRVKLGDALRNAGRGHDAAQVYLAAAADPLPTNERLELRRLAAEQLLFSGHVEEGREVLRTLLDELGMSFPDSPTWALAQFLARRAQLRLRGLEFQERTTPLGDREKLEMDVCWSVALGLAMIDPVRGGIFQSLHLLLALKSGDVARIARALAVEVPFSATPGVKAAPATRMLEQRALTVASRVEEPHVHGLLASSIGGAAWLEGRWADALELELKADEIFRKQCTGVTWEIDTTNIVLLDSLYRLGRWKELFARLPPLLADASMRGDLYTEVYLRIKFDALAHLAQDRAPEASAELDRALGRWQQQRFDIPHYWHLYQQAEAALYRGEARAAWERLEREQPRVKGSLLLHLQLYRVPMLDVRARATLAAAAASEGAERKKLLGQVDKLIRDLEKENAPWADALAAVTHACRVGVSESPARASGHLLDAEQRLERVGMHLHALCARLLRANLSDDAHLRDRTTTEIAAQGILVPAKLTRILAPCG